MTQGTYSSKEGTKCLCPEFHIVVEFEERAKVRKKHWRNLNVIYAVQQWKKQVLKSLIKRRVFKGDYPASGNISSQNFGFCVTDGQPMHIIQIYVLLTRVFHFTLFLIELSPFNHSCSWVVGVHKKNFSVIDQKLTFRERFSFLHL